MALDWSDSAQNILVFETYRELYDRIDSMSVTTDNVHMILYAAEGSQMVMIFRDKSESEQVVEEWTDIRLNSLPVEV